EALFLLLSLVLSDLSHPEAKPLDFVCVSEARKVMNKVKNLQDDLAQCSAAAFLPAPVRTPSIRINMMIWKSQPIAERRAEILQSLRMLAQDIHNARVRSQAECALRLLELLEHNIYNYIHTLTQLHTQVYTHNIYNYIHTLTQLHTQIVSQDLGRVLQNYDRLISRKLEWLVSEMAKDC
ncbi:thrombopoietin isoform X1, partial [Silurus asotus]